MLRLIAPLIGLLVSASLAACSKNGSENNAADGNLPVDSGLSDAGEIDSSEVDGGNIEPVDPLDGMGQVELVQGGFQFLEGPLWRPSEGVLLMSDIPADTIYRVTPPDGVDLFRNPSNNSNGLASDHEGLLLAAEHGSRSVTRTLANGTVETIADEYQGDRLNSPNDLAVRSDGTIYFTDPPYGIDPQDQELSFNGVFRIEPDGSLHAEWEGDLASRPNGVALSPDETVLYVSDTDSALVRVFDVSPDGSLDQERTFVSGTPVADGMTVDSAGNLYVTTSSGVMVFDPDGALWGTISVLEQPANCCFGGADRRTLYITAQTGLYSVRLNVPGL